MPLSFKRRILARRMSSKAYATCTWSSKDRGGDGKESIESAEREAVVDESGEAPAIGDDGEVQCESRMEVEKAIDWEVPTSDEKDVS